MGRYCHGERSGTHGQCGLYGGVVFYTATCARLFYREFPLQNKKDAKDQAEAALLRVLKAEVSAEPVSHDNTTHEIVQAEPTEGLAGVLQQLRERGSLARAEEGEGRTQAEEYYIQKYLDAQLENIY